jgi:hypothetical protein
MRMSICRFLATFTLVALAYPVCGQVGTGSANPNCNCNLPVRQAYTADFKITTVRTLADGTTITRETTETDAQDSQGRHMHALTELTPQMGMAPGTFVNANDPVEGTQSTWDSRTKKVRVVKLPPQDQREGCWASDTGTFRMSWPRGAQMMIAGDAVSLPATNPSVVTTGPALLPQIRPSKADVVDLGTSNIDGLEAHGRRFTTTIQPGEIGNDEPIVTTREVWTSPEIPSAVREVTDDPRTGKRTRELVDFTLGEPDPAAFQPPEGYAIENDEMHKVDCTSAQ